MPSPNLQREFAERVIQKLRSAGYEAYWAGGCVRDQLIGRVPQDYDVATSARPDQVRDLFGHRRTLAIGVAFGVISVLNGRQYAPIEVATFRSDGAYLDGRHPMAVVFTTPEEDARRRDFTINGLFYDPLTEEVIDYVGGQEDLRLGRIRAIGEPRERFAEDKLRMLRAVRFAATLGFQIEPATFAAIQSMAAEIHVVSAERIGGEMRRILVHPQRALGCQLLFESGLLAQIMPTSAAEFVQDPDCFHNALRVLECLETKSLAVAIAALNWNSGDAKSIRQQGRSFRFSNKETDRAAWLHDHLSFVDGATTMPWPQLQRCLVHPGIQELMELANAVLGATHEGVLLCQEKLQLPIAQLNPPELITGDDLIAHGLQPGRYFAQLLETLRNAQLEGQIQSREQALELVDVWMREG